MNDSLDGAFYDENGRLHDRDGNRIFEEQIQETPNSGGNKSCVNCDTINIINNLHADDASFDAASRNGNVVSEIEDAVQKNEPDSKLAKKLAANLTDKLAFDEINSEWYSCHNGIWQVITQTRALKIIDSSLAEIKPLGHSLTKLRAMEGFIRIYLSVDKWITDSTLLPMLNGVLNIKTLELTEYTIQNRFKWQLPYRYEKEATAKIIKQWLWDITDNDIETINIVRAFMKMALIGGKVQKFLEIVGPGGTGKSTLVNLIVMLIGECNHAATDLKNLENNRFEVATLYGKRLAVISDSSRYGGEVSVLKAVTGGDPLRLEKKNLQQTGSFVYDGVVIIASNESIQSTDYSSGLARRRMPINFNRKITDADKEKWRPRGGIEKAMQSELPGLLNWILGMPDDELNAIVGSIGDTLTLSQRQHFCDTNKLAAWIDDNLIIDETSKLYCGISPESLDDTLDIEHDVKTKLYPNYFKWCKANGNMPIAVNRFFNSLEDIAAHAKLPIKLLKRDANGRSLQGFAIRESKHNHVQTPITLQYLSDDKCTINDVLTNSETSANVDCDVVDPLNSSTETRAKKHVADWIEI